MALLRQVGRVGYLELNAKLNEDISRSLEMRKTAQRVIDEGIEYARNLAPEGETGNLQASIQDGGIEIEGQDIVAKIEVGSNAPYWLFVEYGTGKRGAGSEQPEPGLPSGYQHGSSAGMEAQPYMRPTLWYLRQRFQ